MLDADGGTSEAQNQLHQLIPSHYFWAPPPSRYLRNWV